MRLAALISSGKDSLYSMFLSMREGHEIRYIISFVSENPDSYMFHTPNIDLVKEQARLLNIRHVEIQTKGEKEKELEDIKEAILEIRNEIDCIGAGALASRYQYDRVSNICKELGLRTYTPCWMQNDEEHWKELLDAGFEVMITGVAAGGLGKEWLGRKIDWKGLEELKKIKEKYRIHIGGEGGEFESLVLDCPLYKKKIEIKGSKIIWEKETESGHLVIKETQLFEK